MDLDPDNRLVLLEGGGAGFPERRRITTRERILSPPKMLRLLNAAGVFTSWCIRSEVPGRRNHGSSSTVSGERDHAGTSTRGSEARAR